MTYLEGARRGLKWFLISTGAVMATAWAVYWLIKALYPGWME